SGFSAASGDRPDWGGRGVGKPSKAERRDRMDKCIIALDQGTTSSRSILFNSRLEKIDQVQREFVQHFPNPGWVEHDPEEIWDSQWATLRDLIERNGIKPENIAALGITNQRETVVAWDKRTGKPLAPAVVWQDRRTAA